MSEITNLNQARKARARDAKRAEADANAVKFGRTKAERIAEAASSTKARNMLDQQELDKE